MAESKKTEHSRNYEKVKGYYDGGYWNETRLKNAVTKGWITENEYTEITGNHYDA